MKSHLSVPREALQLAPPAQPSLSAREGEIKARVCTEGLARVNLQSCPTTHPSLSEVLPITVLAGRLDALCFLSNSNLFLIFNIKDNKGHSQLYQASALHHVAS